jgi:mannobiose 2-epimerase
MPALNKDNLRSAIEEELTGNILPFWMSHPVDQVRGGFYGAIRNDLQIDDEVPRSAILCARILWTFSAVFRKYGNKTYLSTAQHAHAYLNQIFLDPEYGGLYWSVDAEGNPVHSRKHHYAQAFGIYGLSEYFRATGESQSLETAQVLFHLLEQHGYDSKNGGYIEGSSRDWGNLEDMRLSNKEINCRKSMNSMLHILEAYTNLLRVWEDDKLKARHKALIKNFLEKIIDPQGNHFKLFFDDDWNSLVPNISYGHDIEGSWLLAEAAEVQGDATLLEEVQEAALKMAQAVYEQGRDSDGGLFYESIQDEIVETYKSWWVQAEAMVGFYNAYQLSDQSHFLEAVQQCWSYIQTHLIDRTCGDWYKQRLPDGSVDESVYKVGPWECPYHHSRACLEMIERLG